MSYKVKKEQHVHGKLWSQVAAGYFADKDMAKDYVAAIMGVALDAKPRAIADLGGGTGFVLEQLVEAGIPEDVKLVCVDESDPQLSMCKRPRITPMRGSFQSFRRSDIVGEAASLMLISRSVLQYAGIFGQEPWLRNARGQMKPGEWFVHQSGCFDDVEGSVAVNAFFEMMGVEKWAPHREALVRLLAQAGFEITDDFPVPAVGMRSEELAPRYGFPEEDLPRIEADLRREYSHRPDFFRTTPTGFVVDFPYRVFLCKAAS